MPSKSPQQAALMRAACHDPKIAKERHIPKSVACEFAEADRKLGKFQGKPSQEGLASVAVFSYNGNQTVAPPSEAGSHAAFKF